YWASGTALVWTDVRGCYPRGYSGGPGVRHAQGHYAGHDLPRRLVVYRHRPDRWTSVLCGTAAQFLLLLPGTAATYPGDLGGRHGLLWSHLPRHSYPHLASTTRTHQSISPDRCGCRFRGSRTNLWAYRQSDQRRYYRFPQHITMVNCLSKPQ